MRRFGRGSVLRAVGLLALVGGVGCDSTKATPPPKVVKSNGPLAIRRGEAATRVYSSEEEILPATFDFEGARGSVRVTLEVEGTSPLPLPSAPFINDVLFDAEGDGRISIAFRRPWAGHPNGRVTIRCLSGEEESSAEFEPVLWFHQPSAIVTFEPTLAEPSMPLAEGKEVVLARYVARNLPNAIRLTLKAVFTREPVAPRVKAGLKPPE